MKRQIEMSGKQIRFLIIIKIISVFLKKYIFITRTINNVVFKKKSYNCLMMNSFRFQVRE